MKKFIFYIIAILFLGGCKKDTSGVQRRVEYILPSFTKLILHHNINVIITQDTVNKLKLLAGEKIISAITTVVSDGVLELKNEKFSSLNSPVQNIDVYLNTSELNSIEYNGSGNISSANTLEATTFTVVSLKGAGIINLTVRANHTVAGIYEESADIILKGETNTAYVYCASRGTIDLQELKSRKMNMHFSSVRNGYVWVTEELSGILYHKGNVFYKGQPARQTEEKSSGRFLSF